MEIGEKIKKVLKDNKLSLRAFCENNNLIYTTVTFQINKNSPGYDILEKLYQTFPDIIDAHWLFGNDEEVNEVDRPVPNNEEIIDDVIKKLTSLKKNLTPN